MGSGLWNSFKAKLLQKSFRQCSLVYCRNDKRRIKPKIIVNSSIWFKSDGKTILIRVAKNGYPELSKLLMKKKVDIEEKDRWKLIFFDQKWWRYCPDSCCWRGPHWHCQTFAQKWGWYWSEGRVNENLICKIQSHTVDCSFRKWLFRNCSTFAQIWCKYWSNRRVKMHILFKRNGATALIIAASQGHLNIVQFLIDKEADIEAKSL